MTNQTTNTVLQVGSRLVVAAAATLIWLAPASACTVSERAELAKAGYKKAEIEAICREQAKNAAPSAPVAPKREPAPPSALAPEPPPPSIVGRPRTPFRGCPECHEMVPLPVGSFMMGSEGGEAAEKPRNRVTAAAFAIGRTEVTQAQWRAVMGSNPSKFSDCDNCPVEKVSWDDAQEFLFKLNQRTGKKYRLPSEAEWEYACRAGGDETFCGGESVQSIAWIESNSGNKTHPVATKEPNAWG